MVRKKVEGDEEQRRAAAHKAHRAEEAPSARNVTTGASKQRTPVRCRAMRSAWRKASPSSGRSGCRPDGGGPPQERGGKRSGVGNLDSSLRRMVSRSGLRGRPAGAGPSPGRAA